MTSLVGGRRVRKDCARLEAYGTVDELNSNLGLLLSVLTDETARNSIIAVQNVLFCMGAVLATEEDCGTKMMQSVLPEDVLSLEGRWMNGMPSCLVGAALFSQVVWNLLQGHRCAVLYAVGQNAGYWHLLRRPRCRWKFSNM